MPGYFVRVLFAPRYFVDGPAELKLPKGALSYGEAMRLKGEATYESWGKLSVDVIRAGHFAIVSTPMHAMAKYEVYWADSGETNLVAPIWERDPMTKPADLMSLAVLLAAGRGMDGDFSGFRAYSEEGLGAYYVDNKFYGDWLGCLRRIYSTDGSGYLYSTLCLPRSEPCDWWRTAIQSARRRWISTEDGGYALGGDDETIFDDGSPILFDEVGVDDGEAIRIGGDYEAAVAEGVAIN